MQQRSKFKIETKLINDFPLNLSIQSVERLEKEKCLNEVKNGKRAKDFKIFFNGFKRAMRFGLSPNF